MKLISDGGSSLLKRKAKDKLYSSAKSGELLIDHDADVEEMKIPSEKNDNLLEDIKSAKNVGKKEEIKNSDTDGVLVIDDDVDDRKKYEEDLATSSSELKRDSEELKTIAMNNGENKENEKVSCLEADGQRISSAAEDEKSKECSQGEIQVLECLTLAGERNVSTWMKEKREKDEEESSSSEVANAGGTKRKFLKLRKALESCEKPREKKPKTSNVGENVCSAEVKNGDHSYCDPTDEKDNEEDAEKNGDDGRKTRGDARQQRENSKKRPGRVNVISVETRGKRKRLQEQGDELVIEFFDPIRRNHDSSLPENSAGGGMAASEVSGSRNSNGNSNEDPTRNGVSDKEDKGEKSVSSSSSSNDDKKNLICDKGGGDAPSSSVLSSLRGTLKSLTRSDLEELIIQKLCEVITERSTVGELRRKAQALERDQERWKTKFLMLGKQVREMEMVMKKYLTEVQRQLKEGNKQLVLPLKVTRSVGLQVSFLSNKANNHGNSNLSSSSSSSSSSASASASLPVSNNGSSATPGQSNNAKNTKSGGSNAKLPLTPNSVSAGVQGQAKNKSVPAVEKAAVGPRKSQSTKKPAPENSSPTTQAVSNNSIQNQAPRTRFQENLRNSAGNQNCSEKQPNGSKIIDLTDDDDRQPTAAAVTSPGININEGSQSLLRIVGQSPQIGQSQLPQNGHFAYILPAGSAPAAIGSAATASVNGQNLQVLIASPAIGQPNRQHLVALPPLLKGGSAPQAVPQTVPQPVPQVLNSASSVICPKPSKKLQHPAPLPSHHSTKERPNAKLLPPRPVLKISKIQTGIVLSWNMTLSHEHAPIASYQLYAYQEGNSPPATSLWKKVGDVKALPLPMACTLTQFMSGHKYHFAVRAVDLHARVGPFSFPGTIVLVK